MRSIRSGNMAKQKQNNFFDLTLILFVLLSGIIIGIIFTPNFIKMDFGSLIAAETQVTESLLQNYENDYNARKVAFENELHSIDAEKLRLKAIGTYKDILEARSSFDNKYALSPREKAQLQMHNLSSDSSKSLHDAIRAVAVEAAPVGSDINVNESTGGIELNIDFNMSSVTSGEQGTGTKHQSIDSLRGEVVSIVSRVSNDIYQFCKGMAINSIYLGCRHFVLTTYTDGSEKEENTVLYKIKIDVDRLPLLSNDPFLDFYSITNYFDVFEDNFDEIQLVTR
jgi:hypothetical protein